MKSSWTCVATAASRGATSAPTRCRPIVSRSRSSRYRRPPRGTSSMVSAVAPVAEPANLTRRASLNAVQSLLDYTARLGVGLIVTPILVRGLGQALFCVWQVLRPLLVYLSCPD